MPNVAEGLMSPVSTNVWKQITFTVIGARRIATSAILFMKMSTMHTAQRAAMRGIR